MTENTYSGPKQPFTIQLRRLSAFKSQITFRDPRARSLRPSLVSQEGPKGPEFLVRGNFILRDEYVVARDQGIHFCDITGDRNRIHIEGDVVPGAMTMSKTLLPVEVLMPDLELVDMNVKFTDLAVYGERTLSLFYFRYVAESELEVEISTYQTQRLVAKTILDMRLRVRDHSAEHMDEGRVNRAQLNAVKGYFRALEVDDMSYFQKNGHPDYTYPLSYVVSLPSGAMVKEMNGQGGSLNMLKFEFSGQRRPISGERGPRVRLERARARSSFNRITTEIVEGPTLYCRGSAIVNPKAKLR